MYRFFVEGFCMFIDLLEENGARQTTPHSCRLRMKILRIDQEPKLVNNLDSYWSLYFPNKGECWCSLYILVDVVHYNL